MDTEKNDDKFTQSVGFDEALDKTGEKIMTPFSVTGVRASRHRKCIVSRISLTLHNTAAHELLIVPARECNALT